MRSPSTALRDSAWLWCPVLAVLVAQGWVFALYEGKLWLAAVVTGGPALLLLILTEPAWGLALALALVPLITRDVQEVPLRAVVPLLAVGGAVVAAARATPRRYAHPLLVLAILLVLVAMAVSAMAAVNPRGTLRLLPEFATGVICFFAALQVVDGRRTLHIVLAGAFAGLALAAGYGLLQQVAGTAGGGELYVNGELIERVQGPFLHPNHYATYLVVMIPVGVAVAFSSAFSARLRVFAGSASVVAIPALALSYSRGPIIGLVVGSLAWLALTRPRAAIRVGAVLTVAALAFAPSQLAERFSASSGSADLALRASIWRGAVNVQSQHPLVGAGVNNFPFAYARTPGVEAPAADRASIPEVGGDELPPSAHNEYLNIFAEQGTLGVLAFLAFCATVGLTLLRGARAGAASTQALCLGTGAAVLAWAFHGTVDAITPEATVLLFAFAGVAAALTWRDAEHASQPGASPVRTRADWPSGAVLRSGVAGP